MGSRKRIRPARFAVAGTAALLLVASFGVSAASAADGTLVLTESKTLSADHYGNIVIAADHITLDCAGHTVHGPGLDTEYGGIRLEGVHGVTVKRCIVEGFPQAGFMTIASSHLVIKNNTVRDSAWNGFLIEGTTDSTFSANIASSNGPNPGVGFWIRFGSDRNLFERNVAKANGNAGFLVDASNSVRFVANTASRNAWDGFALRDSAASSLKRNVATGNLKNGFLFERTSGLNVENNSEQGSPWAGFGLYGSQHATLTGNSASGSSTAFDVMNSSGNTLRGNKANGNVGGNGFSLGQGAVSNVLSENVANGNNNGFLVWGDATKNLLTRNLANRNTSYGFVVVDVASDNTFTYNAARASGELDALELDSCVGNTWLDNNFGTTSGL